MPNSSLVVSVSDSASPMPLLQNEQIIFRIRPNIIIPLSFILLIWSVGGLLLYFFVKLKIFNLIPQISINVIDIIFISVFVSVGLIIFLYWLRTDYILTNKRVEWRFGIIGQGVISITLVKIQNIVLNISLIGRIFNFGDIKIEPAGLTASIKFGGIVNPKSRKEQIEEAIG